MTLVEICLEDLAGVAVAEESGADRIELCADLAEGGITPSIGTVAAALRRATRIGVNVLIRQRPGDFVFTADEVDAMVDDIRAIRALARPAGVQVGFVIGALTPGGTVDAVATARLVDACGDAETTFHKAFDQVPDQHTALRELIDLGIHRVLTSGGAPTVTEGAARLAELVAEAGGRIVVLAGGGVRPANVADLVAATAVPEVHLRAAETVPSAGAPSPSDGGSRAVTSGRMVADVLTALGRAAA
ncbi:copper homeostasis protein CutC [Microbacterium sp. ASV49]|uniref:PF03932 family protein CutC n=1 Tax=Microbacterium candidum TaxID=3041922 RepID=A0ABT7N0G1_9MICO|nr:copper homeostasis protein CutC [Microbacterium sp. ASV49]MDL9980196.1 copper homeostasis protein CutC [Microbacterium sp. ASV49]